MHPQSRLALNNDTGLWEIRYTLRDAAGQPHGRKAGTGTSDKNEAEKYYFQWLKTWDDAADGLASPNVAEIIDAYLKDCHRRGVRNSQDYSLGGVLKKELGKYQPQDLSGKPIKKYKEEIRADVSPSTVRRELGALMAAFHWAAHPEKGNMIKEADVPKLLLPQAKHKPRRFLTEEQEEDFLARASKWHLDRINIYVAIGLNTGARKEAIKELLWNRVDLKTGLIDFRVPGARETKKRRVVAPINVRLRPILEAVPVDERVGQVAMCGDIRGAFETFVASTPYPWVTSHIMRHTFITLSLRAGVEIWEVAQMVGDTPEMITRHYGHHQADWRLHNAANKRFGTK